MKGKILKTLILFPGHPAFSAHNFVSGMQSFYFSESPGCNNVADFSLKIVLWTHKFADGLINMGNNKHRTQNCK